MQKDHDYYHSDARMPGEYDPNKPPLRVRFVLWLVDVLRIRQLIGEETGDTMSPALTSSNGQFRCSCASSWHGSASSTSVSLWCTNA